MSCTKKIIINQGESRNLRVSITRDDVITYGKLMGDIPSGPLSGQIELNIRNIRNTVPGNGYLIMNTQADEIQLVHYSSQTASLSSPHIFRFDPDPTNIQYDFYDGYDVSVDGGRVDISQDTITFTARDVEDNIVLEKDAMMVVPEGGEAVIQILSIDTQPLLGEYSYDIIWYTTAGSVIVIGEGILQIKE